MRKLNPFVQQDDEVSPWRRCTAHYGQSILYIERRAGNIRDALYNAILTGLEGEQRKECASEFASFALRERASGMFEYMVNQEGGTVDTQNERFLKTVFNFKARGERDIVRFGQSHNVSVSQGTNFLHVLSRCNMVGFATDPKYADRNLHVDIKVRYMSTYVVAWLLMNRLESRANEKRTKVGAPKIRLNLVTFIDSIIMPQIIGGYPCSELRKTLCDSIVRKRGRDSSESTPAKKKKTQKKKTSDS